MKISFSIIVALFLALTVEAWRFDVTTTKNFCGKRRSFKSTMGDNNCYNLPSDVSANVKSLVWCSMPWTRCSITMHSGVGCTGKILGSATAAYPKKWELGSVSAAGSKMKSFKVQGCKKIGKTLDLNTCYERWQTEPWTKCKK